MNPTPPASVPATVERHPQTLPVERLAFLFKASSAVQGSPKPLQQLLKTVTHCVACELAGNYHG